MKIGFSKISTDAKGTLVLFTLSDRKLSGAAREIDEKSGGLLTRALSTAKYKGNVGDLLEVVAPSSLNAHRIVLAGLGKASDISPLAAEKAGAAIIAKFLKSGDKALSLIVEPVKQAKIETAHMAAGIATGIRLRSFHFDRYFTKKTADQKPSVEKVDVMLDDSAAAKKLFVAMDAVSEGVFQARTLVSEPANVIYPKSYVDEIRKLDALGLKITVLNEAAMRKLGMNALVGVGQGSDHDSYLVVMEWKGGSKGSNEAPVAFVGKGVTFDSGGISLKPGAGMHDMKFDMGGSATVVGLMKALAGRKARVNAIGVVGLVENMPSGNAQRPGDVVTSMSGQTIEIQNTDAEGRLVLADALWYTQDKYKPKFMIDLATLTGAMIVALGYENAGVFSNDDKLSKQLAEAAPKVGEGVWRMPLSDNYEKDIESDIADMKNLGAPGSAGSISAAQFLQKFVNKTPWAHIDIAGTAWSRKNLPLSEKGATGYGVRLLNQLVVDYYEEK